MPWYLRRLTAAVMTAALLVVTPGPDAYRAWAAELSEAPLARALPVPSAVATALPQAVPLLDAAGPISLETVVLPSVALGVQVQGAASAPSAASASTQAQPLAAASRMAQTAQTLSVRAAAVA